MNPLEKRLSEIETELRQAEQDRDLLTARIDGLRGERDTILRLHEPAAALETGIEDLTKAEAIIQILKQAQQPLTLGDIAEAMTAAGKLTNNNGASVYIDTLLKAGRVVRVKRGHYVAA